MKLAELIQDAIKNKGYTEEDFITEIKPEDQGTNSGNRRSLIIKEDKIEFPIDKKKLADIFENNSIEFIIMADDENVILYDKDTDGPEGVYDFNELPSICTTDMEIEENSNIEMLRNQLNYLQKQYPNPESLALIHNTVMIAARLYRNGELSKLMEYNNPFGVIDTAVEELIREYPGVFIEGGEYTNNELLEVLSTLKDYKFDPSCKMARELYNFESRRHPVGIDSDTFDFTRMFLKNGNAVCFTGTPHIPAMVNDMRMDVVSPHISTANAFRFIAGSKNKLMERPSVGVEKYDSQLVIPTFGAVYQEHGIVDSDLPPRSSEEAAFQHALDNITNNGRVVALMPQGFLNDSKYECLRRRIIKDFGLRAIIKMKTPYRDSGMDGYLIIVDREKHNKVLISDEYLNKDSAEEIAEYLESGMENPPRVTGCNIVPQDKYDLEGFQFTYLPFIEDLKGIPLKDCADIITGVNVPSADCYPEGSCTGIMYLRVSNIKNGDIDCTGSKRLSPDFIQDIPQPTDIVLSIHGVIGKSAAVGKHMFVLSRQIVIIRPKEFVSTDTLLKALRSKQALDQMEMLSTGNFLKSLSVSKLKEIKLVL